MERSKNMELAPPVEQTTIDLDIVKEQIIDLNDKFDFLIFTMMKNRKLAQERGTKQFIIGDEVTSSLN